MRCGGVGEEIAGVEKKLRLRGESFKCVVEGEAGEVNARVEKSVRAYAYVRYGWTKAANNTTLLLFVAD